MFKLDLEKAEEPEIKFPTSVGSSEKWESSRKTSTSALLTMPKPLTVWITPNWGKFWKRWEYQTTWSASWEICMQVKKQQLELDVEQQAGYKQGKEYVKAVYCHPAYLTYMQSTYEECWTGWITDGIKIAGKNTNNLRYADDTTLMQRRQWQPTPVLLPGKSQRWRSLVGCSSWGRTESDANERLHFHFSLSCVGERNGNPLQCSCLENARDREAWWAGVYGVAESKRLKWLSSSSSSSSSSMYGCESWIIEKAEHQRIDAFGLWCWRRPLWVPWTARRSNQSILKEISPEYSLEGLTLKLKL